jgi:hypothetical protein
LQPRTRSQQPSRGVQPRQSRPQVREGRPGRSQQQYREGQPQRSQQQGNHERGDGEREDRR